MKASHALAALAVGAVAIAALNGLNYLLEHPSPPPAAPVHRAAEATAPKPLDWTCAPMPNRDHACANLAKLTREAHPNGTENRTAPFVVFTADQKAFRLEGNSLEVICANGTPLMMALQDRHGTRYGAANASEAPKHTRQLAEEICKT